MNERDYKAKLRLHLKPHCYIQSMSSMGTNGTPDLWVSGPNGDLWIEVKYNDKTQCGIKPKLSALQLKWLTDRHKEGRNVMVIIGTSPSEGIICKDQTWETNCANRQSFPDIIKTIIGHIA